MIWTETVIKYAHTRICNKYRPRNCALCPLGKQNGCNISRMIDTLKEWSEKNIPKEVLNDKATV